MNDATPKRMILAELTTQNPIPPALNVVQGIMECKSVYLGGDTPSTQKRWVSPPNTSLSPSTA